MYKDFLFNLRFDMAAIDFKMVIAVIYCFYTSDKYKGWFYKNFNSLKSRLRNV